LYFKIKIYILFQKIIFVFHNFSVFQNKQFTFKGEIDDFSRYIDCVDEKALKLIILHQAQENNRMEKEQAFQILGKLFAEVKYVNLL